jgi:hypothetical protein
LIKSAIDFFTLGIFPNVDNAEPIRWMPMIGEPTAQTKDEHNDKQIRCNPKEA